MRSRVIYGAAVAALGVLPVFGATLEKLALDEMIAKSTEIVRGRVSATKSVQRGAIIYTVAQIQVSERWKGADAKSVEVNIPGGRLGAIRQSFPGAPDVGVGAEYVFFLWTGRSGVTQIIGLSQGLFSLEGSGASTRATRSATTETMIDGRTGAIVTDEGMRLTMAELAARIQGVLGAAKD